MVDRKFFRALCEHCANYAVAKYYTELPEELAEGVLPHGDGDTCFDVLGITAWFDRNHREEFIVQRTLFRLGVSDG